MASWYELSHLERGEAWTLKRLGVVEVQKTRERMKQVYCSCIWDVFMNTDVFSRKTGANVLMEEI